MHRLTVLGLSVALLLASGPSHAGGLARLLSEALFGSTPRIVPTPTPHPPRSLPPVQVPLVPAQPVTGAPGNATWPLEALGRGVARGVADCPADPSVPECEDRARGSPLSPANPARQP